MKTTTIKIRFNDYDKVLALLDKHRLPDLKNYFAINYGATTGYDEENHDVIHHIPNEHFEAFKEFITSIDGRVIEVEVNPETDNIGTELAEMMDKKKENLEKLKEVISFNNDELDILLDALKEQKRRFSKEKTVEEAKGEYVTHLTSYIEENTNLIDKINKMKKA